MEKLLEKRKGQIELDYCMGQILANRVSGFSSNNTMRLFQLLVKYGLNVNGELFIPINSNSFRPMTPLRAAIEYNLPLELVKFLIDSGAYKIMSGNERFAIIGDEGYLSQALKNPALRQLLLEKGTDFNRRIGVGGGYTALKQEAKNGNFEAVRFLVENGAKVNLRADNGETASSLAYDKGEIEIYNYLKEHGAIDFEPKQVAQQPVAPAQSTTNVYVQPSAPAQSNSAPPQTASTGWNLSVMSGTNNIGGTWTSSVGKGNFIVLNGTGTSGSVNIQINGKSMSGTASISGNTLDLYITSGEFKGQQFRYTIVSNKLIQGDGENFNRY